MLREASARPRASSDSLQDKPIPSKMLARPSLLRVGTLAQAVAGSPLAIWLSASGLPEVRLASRFVPSCARDRAQSLSSTSRLRSCHICHVM